MVRIKKLDKRGGLRVKTKKPTAQFLLLEAIWNLVGGPSAVAEAIGEIVQAPANWRLRGRVPLEKVMKVANALGISPWGLNYDGYSAVVHPYPTWEEVVNSYGLPAKTVKAILKARSK